MSKELSTFRKGKVILELIQNLKNLPNKDTMYINSYYDQETKIMEKIAKRSGIQYADWANKGVVDISDEVSIALDDRIHNETLKLNGEKRHQRSYPRDIEFAVSDELKQAVEQFEKKHIPPSGPCSTHIGEIFRAIQFIQYRAFNDGDLCWDPGSPSFMSYVYVRSQVDELNYSKFSYQEETGQYCKFEFKDEFLNECSYGQISDVIEDSLAQTANFIKCQIMDLLLNGKIEDSENEFDSRDFESLKKERYW